MAMSKMVTGPGTFTPYHPYAQRVYPCAYCRHKDCRDETHARGCPKLEPVTQERMLAIAQACERGWRDAAVSARRSRATA